jgi:hypothetical protein
MLRSKRRRRYFGLLCKVKGEKNKNKLKDPQIFPILFIFSSKKYFCKEIDITKANAALIIRWQKKSKENIRLCEAVSCFRRPIWGPSG